MVTPTGILLLQDEANGYTLAKDCFATRPVAFRTQEISSPWAAGELPVRAVGTNIAEQLVVDINAGDQYQLYTRTEKLLGGLRQLSYSMTVTFANHQEIWTCFISPWTQQDDQEWRVAVSRKITVQLKRHPAALVSQV